MVVPLHSSFFSTLPVAVADNKIFHMVTLILHEIWKIKGKITKSESRLFSSVPLLRREIASSWSDDVFLSLQNMALLISTLFLLTASEWVFGLVFFFFF